MLGAPGTGYPDRYSRPDRYSCPGGPITPPWKSAPPPAAKRRKNAAHGASRGWCCEEDKAPEGRQNLAQEYFPAICATLEERPFQRRVRTAEDRLQPRWSHLGLDL